MRLISRSRPSPAFVVPVIALTAAFAGTAIAGPDATTSVSKKKTKQIAKNQVNKLAPDIANQEITARAPGLSVANAQNATNAENATNATNAVVGAPRAYAGIAANGTLLPGYPAKGIANAQVTNPDTGAYCFDLPFAPVTAAANAEAEGDEDGILTIQLVPGNFTDCPATAKAEVRNFDASEGADQNDSFQVQFDG
jgi:hypothetical protein